MLVTGGIARWAPERGRSSLSKAEICQQYAESKTRSEEIAYAANRDVDVIATACDQPCAHVHRYPFEVAL